MPLSKWWKKAVLRKETVQKKMRGLLSRNGRITPMDAFSLAKKHQHGLVDQLGNFDDAVKFTEKFVGIEPVKLA